MEKEDKRRQSRTSGERRKADALRKLMKRYIAGDTLTADELQILDQVVIPEDDRRYVAPDSEAAGRRILDSVYAGTAGNKNKKEPFWFRRVRHIPLIYRYGVAAAFLVLISVGIFLRFQANNPPQTIELAALNEVETFSLPDGSTVYLNRGSRLSYDGKLFDARRREIHLTGEAFFEVATNPEKPFIVYGGETTTTVRGTSFNVKAYPGVRKNVVSVRDGRVEVASTESGMLAVLTQNQQVTWDTETHTARRDSIDWLSAAGWKEGKALVFNSAGLDEIKWKIEQWYGTPVAIDRVADLQISFYGSYPTDDGGATLLQELGDIYGIYSKRDNGRIEFYRQLPPAR